MQKKKLTSAREWVKFNVLRPSLLGVGKAIAPFSTVGNHPVFSNDKFPHAQLLEKNWPAIRKELEAVMQFRDSFPSIQEIQQEQMVLTTDNKWKTFFLYGFGTKSERNCSLCPETARTLEQIPGLLTAFFSIMYPKKHIQAHKGLFKGILRTHLGMIIPDNNKYELCRMQVDKELIVWKEGEAVVFDDTYRHEVWNDSDDIRVVLLIDTIRPFKQPFRWLNKGIINLIVGSSHVKEAVDNHKAWESKFNQLFS
ncbi:MAG: aspartyl/asparaginyl beta-hydroxylase domain-containing protein [Sphingobacteriales bacterium]|nr:MAG: aspartyl/asparaginyl beta-hydroxylase domain-containing protein [Sphingobacteriales bacterium]